MSSSIIFDTNTLISAAIFPQSTPARAYQKAKQAGELVASQDTLIELALVLERPKFDKYVSLDKRRFFYTEFADIVIHVPIVHTVTDCRDPKDNKFLELALSASNGLIVSGDSDLLALHPFRGIAIVSPADFLAF